MGRVFESRVVFSALSAPWWLDGAAVDLDFQTSRYFDGADNADVTTLLSCSRASIGYAQTVAGTLTQFLANELRITDQGLLIENARTNVVLWNRDLTDAAWTASNITTAKDQTGPDGVSNSASSITASAGNGTILQAITLASSARYQSAWVKRLTGSGVINMTMDNGATWTAITVTAGWTKVEIPTQTLANPTVGFRIVTNGDAIAVDFVQNEDGAFASSPIPTTTAAATRAADSVGLISTTDTCIHASAGSVVADAIINGRATPAGFEGILGTVGTEFAPLYIPSSTEIGSYLLFNGTDNISATLGSSLTWALGAKSGVSWSVTGRSLVGGGGTMATTATDNSAPSADAVFVGKRDAFQSLYGYVRRLTFWNSRLADGTLQGFTVP